MVLDAVSDAYAWLTHDDGAGNVHVRATLWYTFARLLCVVQCWAMLTLAPQLRAICGRHGLQPVSDWCAALRRDFPSFRRFVYAPSLLWLNPESDAFLVGLMRCGGVIAAVGAVLGPQRWMAVAVWAIYASYITPANLSWPWDMLLCESTFLSIFLSFSPTEPPSGLVCWAFRWLMFRLMFGFGKTKFDGAQHPVNSKLYLKAFMTFQPLPNAVAYWAQHYLPPAVFRAGNALFWCAEIPLPFLFLAWGRVRLVAAVGTALLQCGIQLSGTFGFFNALSLVLCVPALDVHSVLFGGSGADSAWGWSHPIVWLLFPHSLMLGVFFNSWISQVWYYMPQLRVFEPVRGVLRWFHPLYLVSAYGVFPPNPLPAERVIPVLEGSADGVQWHEYQYRYICGTTHQKPPTWLGPYHPRIEYYSVYVGVGMLDGLAFVPPDPYLMAPHRTNLLTRVCARLLRGGVETQPLRDVFGVCPFPDPDAPPRYMRVRAYLLTPSSETARRKGGAYWTRALLHTHTPTHSLRDTPLSAQLYTPDGALHVTPPFWTTEHAVWRARWRAEPQSAALWSRLLVLDPAVVPDAFWTQFVAHFRPFETAAYPLSMAEGGDGATPSTPFGDDAHVVGPHDTTAPAGARVPSTVWSAWVTAEYARYQRTFSAAQRLSVETAHGFVSWALCDALDALPPPLKRECLGVRCATHYTFTALHAQALVCRGREWVQQVLDASQAGAHERVAELVRSGTGSGGVAFRFETAFYYLSVFAWPRVVYEARKRRVMLASYPRIKRPQQFMPGYFTDDCLDWLCSVFRADAAAPFIPPAAFLSANGANDVAGAPHPLFGVPTDWTEWMPRYTFGPAGWTLTDESLAAQAAGGAAHT